MEQGIRSNSKLTWNLARCATCPLAHCLLLITNSPDSYHPGLLSYQKCYISRALHQPPMIEILLSYVVLIFSIRHSVALRNTMTQKASKTNPCWFCSCAPISFDSKTCNSSADSCRLGPVNPQILSVAFQPSDGVLGFLDEISKVVPDRPTWLTVKLRSQSLPTWGDLMNLIGTFGNVARVRVLPFRRACKRIARTNQQ